MSIQILCFTVVTRRSAIEQKYSGGLQEYTSSSYVWHDDDLVGSSFMNGLDVQCHLEHLFKYGISFDGDMFSTEVAVIDQRDGALTKCDWLEFRRCPIDGAICWMKGMERGVVALGWEKGGYW